MNDSRQQTNKNDRSISISGDARESAVIMGDHNTVIQNLVTGLTRLPTDYATRIENFLYEYLGTAHDPVPFGGRLDSLSALDAWLDNSGAPPYALLAAEAGRGKSALLVRWTKRLMERGDVHLVFVPVSIRFNTALAPVTFTALAARLGEVYGEPVEWANLSAEQWRGVSQSYLSRTPPDGKPLVVILDGLDEAADWQAGEDLFPRQPPTGVRIVVSARFLAGDVDEGGWRRRLGWTSEKLAYTFPLRPLTLSGLRDVLHEIGNPLDQLASDVDVVSELYRLSEGDPLLVRLYIEALLAYGEDVAIMSPEELRHIQPGLSGYFERWWKEQHRLWGAEKPLRERHVRVVLNLLACALGPLDSGTLLELALPESNLDTWTLEDALEPLARFIVGDGKKQGYVFSHPRLGYYFWHRLSEGEQRQLEDRFLNFGCRTLERVNDGTLDPHHAPSVAIQYYGAHLERAEAPPEAFYALVSEGWMRAWEALEGTHAGFLNDVERAWQRAETERDIAMQIKCALCYASVMALSANIPPKLLAQAVSRNLLTPVQALVIAQQKQDEEQRGKTLAELAPFLPDELLGEALRIARGIASKPQRIGDSPPRAIALRGLAPYLTDKLLAEALEVTWTIENDEERIWTLSGLAPCLSEPKKSIVLRQALQAARVIEDTWQRAEILRELALQLPDEQKNEVLREVIEASWMIWDDWARFKMWSQLVPDLPNELLTPAFLDAAEIIEINESPSSPSWLLDESSSEFSNERLAQILKDIPLNDEEWETAWELSWLAPYLPEELLAEALQIAWRIEFDEERMKALSILVPYLPDKLLAEALRIVQTIRDDREVLREVLSQLRPDEPDEQLETLIELVPHLPHEQKNEARRETLQGIEAIKLARSRGERLEAENLIRLIPHLPDEQRKEVFDKAINELFWSIHGYDTCELDVWRALSCFVANLPDEQRESVLHEALQMILAIQFDRRRVEMLIQLASNLPDKPKRTLLHEALGAFQSIEGNWNQIRSFWELAPVLSDEQLEQTIEVARSITYEQLRVEALGKIASCLPDELKNELLNEAFEAAQTIKDNQLRTEALIGLAPHLPDKQKNEVFYKEFKAAWTKRYRSEALSKLAVSLQVWMQTQPYAATAAWQEALRHLSQKPRPEFLSDLHALMPFTLALAEKDVEVVAVGISRAIQEVCEWWP